MKKVVSLILSVIMMFCIVKTANAALSCKVNVQTTNVTKEEVIIDIKVSDIQSDDGVIAFSTILEYDNKILSLDKIEGKNGWSNPSYNESNGQMVTDRSNPTKDNETIMTITFKVKNNNVSGTTVNVKDSKIANGVDKYVKFDNISKNIIINEEASNPPKDNENSGTNNQNPSTDNKKPNGDNQNSGTNNQNPATNNKNPSSNDQSQGTNNQNQGSNGQSQGTNNQNQGSNGQNQGTSNQSQSSENKKYDKTYNSTSKGNISNGNMPKTGESDVLIYAIGGFTIITIILLVRIIVITKKQKEEN